jgi:hypothetical protein
MTIQLTNQIMTAERDLDAATTTHEGRFVPTAQLTLRGLGVRAIRTTAKTSLKLADRLDPCYRYA